jgi:2-amino-4-hydroxy-6-hydroxymethyldihydropteridine diphosphokinase
LVYLGLGSNIGDKKGYLKKAESEISKILNTKVLKSSSIYKTEPWGIKNQDFFLNSVLEINTSLKPAELMAELKRIEIILGRKEREKWFQREIDIDLLFYEEFILEIDKLKIPHPEISNRNFVLIPLCEVNPELLHPVLKKTVTELLNESKDNSAVTKLEDWDIKP